MKVYLVYKGADVRYVLRKSNDARRLILELDPEFDFDDDGGHQSSEWPELVDGLWDDPDSEWSVKVWEVREAADPSDERLEHEQLMEDRKR